MAVSIGDDVAFVLWNLLIEVGRLVGDEEAVGLRKLREDCAANECVISMTLHIFLQADDLISQLLQGKIVQVPRVDQLHIVSEVIIAFLGGESLQSSSQLVGRAEASDFADEVLEGDIRVLFHSSLGIRIDPLKRMLPLVDHKRIRNENNRSLSLTRDQFLPEVCAGLHSSLLILVAVEDGVGLLFEVEHDHSISFFH